MMQRKNNSNARQDEKLQAEGGKAGASLSVTCDWGSLVIAGAIMAWGIWYVATIPVVGNNESMLIPSRLLLILLAFGCWVLKISVHVSRSGTRLPESFGEGKYGKISFAVRPRIILLLSYSAFIVLLPILGFVPAAALFLFIAPFCMGYKNIKIIIGLAACFIALTTVLLIWLLAVPLPLWPSLDNVVW